MRTAFLIYLLTALGLSACVGVPQSRSALSEPGEAPYEERLVGFWALVGAGESGTFYLQITSGGTGLLRVLFAVFGIEADGKSETRVLWVRATAHASEINGETYYNVKPTAAELSPLEYEWPVQDEEQQGFMIMQAELSDDDKLYLHFMNPAIVRELIEEGRVAGREVDCGKGNPCSYNLLQVSRPELIALIKEVSPENLFVPLGVGPFPRQTIAPIAESNELCKALDYFWAMHKC